MRFVSRSVLLALLILAVTATVFGCTPAPDEVEPEQTQEVVAQKSPKTAPTSQTDGHSIADPETSMSENRRWCQAWALDNLEPLVYVEFLELDPLNMDDIDRTIWRDRLRNASCSMYGSEPLNAGNANRRNEQYKVSCLQELVDLVDYQWETIAGAAYERDNPNAFEIPNQYVRIMRWMHLTGDELLAMHEPPYVLLKRLHGKDYASEYKIPSADRLVALQAEYGDEFTTEWWSLPGAALGNRSHQEKDCHKYYPQLFTGYWIPYAQPPQTSTLPTSTPSPGNLSAQEERNSKIQSILQSSLYLPKP